MSQSSPRDSEERIQLGHITGVYGLQGWVKVHSDTQPRDNIVKYASWWLQQHGHVRSVTVLNGRPQGKTIIAKLDGVDTPEEAAELIGSKIAVPRAAMPPVAEGEYYWADLIGMAVRTAEGENIGSINRLFETGANDVVVITDERPQSAGAGKSRREILVPWLVPDVITDVNLAEGTITVDWDPDF